MWSVGVIFYQMLFGRRPFGEGMTQQRILTSGSILRATSVAFPQKPGVSEEAKAFIRKCLTHNQHLRPDVLAMAKDPYVILGGRGGRRRG